MNWKVLYYLLLISFIIYVISGTMDLARYGSFPLLFLFLANFIAFIIVLLFFKAIKNLTIGAGAEMEKIIYFFHQNKI